MVVKIEDIFNKAVEDCGHKNIGTIILFGSLDPRHDIDTIIMPSQDAKMGEFSVEYMNLIEEIKKRSKQDLNRDFIPFPLFNLQADVSFYGAEKEDILWHSQTYANSKDLRRKTPRRFLERISYPVTIKGDMESLFNEEQHNKIHGLHYYFTLINSLYPLFSKHPDKFADLKTRLHCGYVRKYLDGKEKRTREHEKKILNKEDCLKIYKEMFRELDRELN